MGSKRKLLDFILEVAGAVQYETVLDAFSGSGCVSYAFKSNGKRVTANDFLAYSYHISNAAVANSETVLTEHDVDLLLWTNPESDDFIQRTFNGLYFTPEDNAFLDGVSANLPLLDDNYKRSLAIAALCRAAMKKQPRGVFTVVGSRYDDGRRDLRLSMRSQFLEAVAEFNGAVFGNGRCNAALNEDVFSVDAAGHDLVYLDPPYYSVFSDNDYIRRYHFLEGLATYWRGVTIREDSKTKRIEKRDTPFSSKKRIYGAFDELFGRFRDSALLVSYSSNCLPRRDEMVTLLKKYKQRVEVVECEHRYSFGNQNHTIDSKNNTVREYLFLGY